MQFIDTLSDSARTAGGRLASTARPVLVVTLSVLLVVSIFGPGVVMLPGVDEDHSGAAAAAVEDSSYVQSYNVSSEEDTPHAVTFNPNGTEMYVSGASGDLYQYDLSASWDVSTASYSSTSLSSGGLLANGVAFGADGLKLYIAEANNDDIYEYDLSTAYNISTASKTNTLDVSSEDGAVNGVEFNDDGTRMYVVGNNGVKVIEYSLSTAWDTSTASVSHTFDVSSEASGPKDARFNEDGSLLLLVDDGTDAVYEYELSTPYDLSTATYTSNSYDVSSEDGSPNGLAFGDSDTKMYTVGGSNGKAYEYDTDVGTDAVYGDITGQVTDQNGDPVKNATVYTADWSTSDPPQITTNRDLAEIQDHPFPSGWDSQLDIPGVNAKTIDPSEPDWSSTRVLLHTAEQWELQGPNMGRSLWEYVLMEDNEPRSEIVNPDVNLEEPKAAIAPDQAAVLTCWEFDDSNLNINILDHPDPMDDSIPGAATQPCTMVIEEVDPIDGTYSKRTEETHPFVEYDAKIYSRVDDKTHEAVLWRPSEGLYKVYPEDSPEEAMYYVVAPGADPANHKAKIANVAKSKEQAISKFNEKMQEEYDAGNLDIASTTTNSTGYYGLNVQSAVNETDIIALKPGTTREDARSNIETATKQNFRAESPTTDSLTSESWTQPEFEKYCREMDSVMAETGVPFEGHERNVHPPSDNVDIQGVRAVPSDVNQEVSECYAINTAEKILQDGLAGLFPGMQDNLADLSREDLEQRYREVLSFIDGSAPLESELDDRLSGDIETILDENPEDLTRDELETRVSEGIDTVDSGGDTGFSGGGGSATSPPTVSPPDTGTGQETLNAVWQVGQVDNWADASLLVRLHYNNGTTTMLNESSEYITIEESTVGADTVRLSDYPLGETDPATVQVGLDIATPDGSAGDPDDGSGVVRNPTFDGDIPQLRDMRVSKFAPGPSDNVTIGVTPEETSRFGTVKHANVSHSDCSYSTTATDGELDIWTCGEGSHHVKVTFTNPGGVEFVEVLKLDAKAAAQTRPASIRAKVGPIGRYAVTNGQLAGGDIQTNDGASTLEVIAIAEPDNIPNSITASTIGMDVASDSNTVVRVVEGDARQTVRKRVGVVLHRNAPSEGSLLYRNERAVPTNGETSSARIETDHGKLTMDSFTSETGTVTLRVVEDPSIIQRIRHWADLKIPFSLPVGFVSGDAVLFLAPLLVYRRRRKRPPNTGNGDGEVAA